MSDVTDATFETDVIDRSFSVPVIVDLWAPWCGPCKTLGPMLETQIAATAGRVELAKVNVDENPAVAAAFAVKSIPAVFAFVDGKVVDGFLGAQPESKIAELIATLVPQLSEVDLLVATGDEASLKKAIELDPTHPQARLALGRLLLDAHRPDEVPDVVGPVLSPEAEALLAEAKDALDERDGAFAAVAGELSTLLGTVKADPAAKERYLEILMGLPGDDPRTIAYRKALSAQLF